MCAPPVRGFFIFRPATTGRRRPEPVRIPAAPGQAVAPGRALPQPTVAALLEVAQSDVAGIAHSIQLSVAPVFLLSGIGVLLGVLTNRLARIVDRARPLEQQLAAASGAEAEDLHGRLRALQRRARCSNLAITLSTVAALLVAIVVALLFASNFVQLGFAVPIATLFVLSMLALVGALLAFLVEVRIATRTIRIGPPLR